MRASKPLRVLLLVAALAAAAVAYWPGVGGPFVFDDVERILRSPPLAMTVLDVDSVRDAMLSGQQAYPNRGLSRLTLALDHYLAGGFDARRFKLTNIAIHIANGALVYWLSALLVGGMRRRAAPGRGGDMPDMVTAYLPLLASAMWVLHPVQLTGVLYVVQRMTSLSATFVFAGLVVFVIGRGRFARSRPSGMPLMVAGIAGGTALGFLSKENAVLLPLFALLIDLSFYRAEWRGRRRRRLLALYAVFVALPLLALAAAAVLIPGFSRFIFAGYRDLGYGPGEQLLTQPRVLFFYLGLILVPDVRRFGLFHDDFATSGGWLEPWTTLPSLLGLVALVVVAVWGWRRGSVVGFGLLWFLVGHAIESTVLPLELVYEHRNYLPSFGILFAAAYLLLRLGDRLASGRRVVYPLAGTAVLVLALATLVRASDWQSAPTLLEAQVRRHPGSYRARLGYAADGLPRTADAGDRYRAFQSAARLRPRAVAPLIEMAKLAAAVHDLLAERGPAAVPGGGRPGVIDLLHDPLAPDAPTVGRQRERIDRAIESRLTRYPVDTEAGIALVQLGDCVIGGGPCRRLGDAAFTWHRAAIANRQSAPETRAVVELSLAKLYAGAGDRERAIEHARRAGELAPENLSYRLAEARLYALLEAWDEAGRVLDELDARDGGSKFLRRDFARLRRELRSRDPGKKDGSSVELKVTP